MLLVLFSCSFYGYTQTESEQKTASIKAAEVNTKVKVFPNPATNVVNVLGLKNSLSAQISISDVYGNALLSHQWEIRKHSLNIPITVLPAGTYMITVCSNEENVKAKFYKR